MVQNSSPSFRDGPKDQTRNFEIPGSRFARPGMTIGEGSELMGYYVYILASRKDGAIYIGRHQ